MPSRSSNLDYIGLNETSISLYEYPYAVIANNYSIPYLHDYITQLHILRRETGIDINNLPIRLGIVDIISDKSTNCNIRLINMPFYIQLLKCTCYWSAAATLIIKTKQVVDTVILVTTSLNYIEMPYLNYKKFEHHDYSGLLHNIHNALISQMSRNCEVYICGHTNGILYSDYLPLSITSISLLHCSPNMCSNLDNWPYNIRTLTTVYIKLPISYTWFYYKRMGTLADVWRNSPIKVQLINKLPTATQFPTNSVISYELSNTYGEWVSYARVIPNAEKNTWCNIV